MHPRICISLALASLLSFPLLERMSRWSISVSHERPSVAARAWLLKHPLFSSFQSSPVPVSIHFVIALFMLSLASICCFIVFVRCPTVFREVLWIKWLLFVMWEIQSLLSSLPKTICSIPVQLNIDSIQHSWQGHLTAPLSASQVS